MKIINPIEIYYEEIEHECVTEKSPYTIGDFSVTIVSDGRYNIYLRRKNKLFFVGEFITEKKNPGIVDVKIYNYDKDLEDFNNIKSSLDCKVPSTENEVLSFFYKNFRGCFR